MKSCQWSKENYSFAFEKELCVKEHWQKNQEVKQYGQTQTLGFPEKESYSFDFSAHFYLS